jgi:hypothetical protein
MVRAAIACLAAVALFALVSTPAGAEGLGYDLKVDALDSIHGYVSGGSLTFVWRITDLTGDNTYLPNLHIVRYRGPYQEWDIPLGPHLANRVVTTTLPNDFGRGAYWWMIDLNDVTLCYEYTQNYLVVDSGDRQSPTTVPLTPSRWIGAGCTVAVRVLAVDDASGVVATEQSFDGGISWQPWLDFDLRPAADGSGDGVWTSCLCRSTDGEGNVEEPVPVTIRIDTQAPATTDTAAGGWHSPPYDFALTPTDATSGVWRTSWQQLGRDVQVGTTVSLGTTTRILDGEQRIAYWSVDLAGNAEEPKYATVNIDGSPPTTRDDSDGQPHSRNVTVHFSAYDGFSGLGQTYYAVDGEPTWHQGSQVTIPAAGNAGTHYIWYYSSDQVGNVEPTRVTWVVITSASSSIPRTFGGRLHHSRPIRAASR